MDEAIGWLRRVIEGDLAGARKLLSEEWGDRPWAVTECGSNEAHHCPCIVYQGEYKPFDLPQVPPIRYIADGETPELAAWIARHDPRAAIARCEAELAILDRHHVVLADRGGGAHPQYRVVREQPSAQHLAQATRMQWDVDCAECRRYWPCRTLRDIASGYRHRDGYAKHWGA